MTRRRARPEQQTQRAVIGHLQWRARPLVWWTHIPLGGWRTPTEARIFKGLGVRSGAPDLLIVADGQPYFLELKTKGGRVSEAQAACHKALRDAGARVAVAVGVDEAVAQLTTWGLLRGRRS